MFDSVKEGMDSAKIEAVKRAIEDAGISVSGLEVSFDGDAVTLKGSVDSSADKDAVTTAVKAIVSSVDNQIKSSGGSGGSGKTHTVVSGDTLWAISQHYYGDGNRYMEIYNANKSVIGGNPDLIQVGQHLQIP